MIVTPFRSATGHIKEQGRYEYYWLAAMARDFSIGDRVRISAVGATRSPRLADRTGKIVGRSIYTNSFVVLFDGNKSTSTFHGDYLELVQSDAKITERSGLSRRDK